MLKPRILILIGRYLPGYNSGGPVRTLSSIVERLGDQFDFLILTHDRDDNDKAPYRDIAPNRWNSVGKAKVFYTSSFSLSVIRRIVREVRPDALYLNGYFSTSSIRALLLRRLGLLADIPVVLAPRGDLAPGAMSIRSLKKSLYRGFARVLGIYNDLLWHVSSQREFSETARAMSPVYPDIESRALIAPDLSSFSAYHRQRPSEKQPGAARFVSLARICSMKNVAHLLACLPKLSGDVEVDLFGPMEDAVYWESCLKLIADLPTNIHVNYRGVIPQQDVQKVLATYDFFVLPTAGENFGHVILEAASAGVPVVISDRTQWLHLQEENVGWDLPLERKEEWVHTLQTCIDMDEVCYARMSAAALHWGAHHLSDPQSLAQNVHLFLRAARRGSSHASAEIANARLSR